MKTPNILIFMTDQQRWDTAPPFSRAKMPRLETFAQEGLTFSKTYCPSPHCCPSRATFFTGLYPTEHGVWNNVQVANALSRGLQPGVSLFSDHLQGNGYDLYYSGKWHVSSVETPRDRGWQTNAFFEKQLSPDDMSDFRSWPEWQQYRELQPGAAGDRGHLELNRPGYPPFKLAGPHESPFRDRETVEGAVEWIQSRTADDTPWCQFVGTLGPHDPYIVPQRFLDLYPELPELPASFYDTMQDKPGLYRKMRDVFNPLTPEEHQEAIRHYLAFCSYEDWLFGQVLDALDASVADNTLVVYLSDHGDYLGEHGLWAKGLPCFQSCYRVPAIVRWPQGIEEPGRTVDEFVSLADFAPTFLEAAGLPPASHCSGRSLVPFFQNEVPPDWRDAIFTQTNGNELYGIQRSVTTTEWNYVYNGFDYDELYHLTEDPMETKNLLADGTGEYDPIVKELSRRLWQFAYEHNDACVNPYITVALARYGPGVAFADETELD